MQNDSHLEPSNPAGEPGHEAPDASQDSAVHLLPTQPEAPAESLSGIQTELGFSEIPAPAATEALADPSQDAAVETPVDPAVELESSEASEDSDEPAEPLEGFDFAALEDLAGRSQTARLSVADEERMCELLKAALLAGKATVAQVGPLFAKMPWIVGVRAVETVWAAMKVSTRSQLLRILAEDESEASRRLRLSLARALFKLDPATGLKLLIAVCKELRDKETGVITSRNAQVFNNVFIGKAKPWILQVALAELKPADADLVVQCALGAAFSQPTPPVPLLSLLRWVGEADLLSKLPESTLAVLPKGLSRMSFKWQSAIRKEVANLPESILALLKPIRSRETQPNDEAPEPETAVEPAPEGEPVSETEAAPENDSDEAGADSAEDGESVDEPDSDEAAENSEDDSADLDDEKDEEPKPRKPRPVYEPRPQRANHRESREPREEAGRRDRPVYQGRQPFNLSETLRQIEAHVQSLRTELSGAQAKLRQRDDDSRRERRPDKPVPLPGAPSNEELTRLNLQLEARILELQTRVEEISKDAEDRAASQGAHTDGPAPDPDQQLRVLLGLKLQEDYADFLALENESLSTVVQQHYRTLLRHIFEVLKAENVPLQN